jgi:hypothetical protein
VVQSGTYVFLAQDRVIFGKPANEAVAEEAARRNARRVFVVASKTLNRETDVVAGIRSALGERFAGLFDETREHVPRDSVLAAAAVVRAANPRPDRDRRRRNADRYGQGHARLPRIDCKDQQQDLLHGSLAGIERGPVKPDDGGAGRDAVVPEHLPQRLLAAPRIMAVDCEIECGRESADV